MRTLEITFRRKYPTGNGDEKKNYGNSEEKVESGPNKGETVPCFRIQLQNVPTNEQELIQDIGGQKNFDKFIDTIYNNGYRELFKSDVLLKLAKDAEKDSAIRDGVIEKAERLAREFSMARVIAETLTAKSALDELNTPEMQTLAANDPVEFARRVQSILSNTRGVASAAA